MALNTDITYCASGFYEDCTKLLETFKRNENVRFKAFCNVWQEMKFSLVFLCRKTYAEMLEFCEESLYVAKQLFLSNSEVIDQVGGLYLLYGLYYKMPVENIKIRVTMKEWLSFLNFYDQINDKEFHDVSFIFIKLVKDHAFHHCLFATEYGLEKHLKTRQEYTFENPYSILPNLVDEIESGELVKIQKMNQAYEEHKTRLLSNVSSKKLELYDSSFVEDIVNQLEELQEKRQTLSGLRKKTKELNLVPRTDKSKYHEQDKIRPKLGHGFDTDSSDNDDMEIENEFVHKNQRSQPGSDAIDANENEGLSTEKSDEENLNQN